MRRSEGFVLSALNAVLGYPYFNSVTLSAIFRLVEKFPASSGFLSANVWGVFTSLLESLGFTTAYLTPVWELNSIRESHCSLVTFDSLTLHLVIFRRTRSNWHVIYTNRVADTPFTTSLNGNELQERLQAKLEEPNYTAILVCGNAKSLAENFNSHQLSVSGDTQTHTPMSDSGSGRTPTSPLTPVIAPISAHTSSGSSGLANPASAIVSAIAMATAPSTPSSSPPTPLVSASSLTPLPLSASLTVSIPAAPISAPVQLPALSAFSDSATAAQLPEYSILDSILSHGVISLDKSGCIRHWNRGAEELTGFPLDSVLGFHFSMLFPPEDIQRRTPQAMLDAVLEHGRLECEGWRVKKDNNKWWASMSIFPIRGHVSEADSPSNGGEGEVLGFSVLLHDSSASRVESETLAAQREALRESEERQRMLIDSVLDYAVFMLDMNGAVSSWNAGAQRLKGYTAQEIIGKHFSVFYPALDIANSKPQRELQFAMEKGRFEEEGWRRRKDGSNFWANVIITAMKNSSGQVIGFAKVTRDMTERKRAQEKLVQQQHELMHTAERLKEADVAKTLFIQKLSHELRAPLNPVTLILTEFIDRYKQPASESGESSKKSRKLEASSSPAASSSALVSSSDSGSFPPAEVVQDMEIALNSIQRECALIDDLLDTTRLNTGKLKLDYRNENMHELLEELISTTRRSEAALKGIEIRQSFHASHSQVWIDPSRMAQVFLNIIGNSVKFTPAGGSVTIETENLFDSPDPPSFLPSPNAVTQSANNANDSPPQWLLIRISDTGVGFAPNYQEKIFELFAQAPVAVSNSTNFQGLGLGLAIAKGILDLHGATISAFSEGENRGSSFLIKFPLADNEANQSRLNLGAIHSVPAPIPSATEFTATSGVFQSPQERRDRRAELADSLPAEAKKWQLLVVEDDRVSLKLLTAFLKSLGFTSLESAPSLAAAGKVVQSLKQSGKHVDLLISDIHLHDGTGFDIIKSLRHEFPAVPIDGIVCSGSGAAEDLLTSQQAGFAVHLVKPIDSLKLARAVFQIANHRMNNRKNGSASATETENERKRKREDSDEATNGADGS